MGSGIGKRAREIVKPALERIETLEKNFQQLLANQQGLLEGNNQAFTLVEERFTVHTKLITAIVKNVDALSAAVSKLTGETFPTVEDTVKQQIMEQAQKRADVEKVAIAAAVKDGQLIVSEVIGPQSVIVGREILKDGTVRHPGWEQFMLTQAKPEIQSVLIGKRAGDRIEIPVGELEVLEVYDIVIPPEGQAAEGPPEQPPVDNDHVEAGAEQFPEEESSEEDADKALEDYLAASAPAENT